MRDFRSSLLILLSVLLLISIGLLITAFYHFYYKVPVYKPVVELTSKDKIIITSGTRDSLQQLYFATLKDLDKRLDAAWNNADSLNTNLDIKISEFYKLRKEISAILKDRSANADLGTARQKIKELQDKVSALRFINKDVEKENERLNELLSELKTPGNEPEQERPGAGVENKVAKEKPAATGTFAIAELRLSAYRLNNEKELETFTAQEAEKLSGSFTVKSTFPDSNPELMIVIVQPDGKVLQNSAWDVGTFETPQGKKIYSRKINFEYKKGEIKKLQFSIGADNLQKGNYTLQVYHQGVLAGSMIKTLL